MGTKMPKHVEREKERGRESNVDACKHHRKACVGGCIGGFLECVVRSITGQGKNQCRNKQNSAVPSFNILES